MAEKNPIIEINRRAMEFIWQKVPKVLKDGQEFVTYTKTDLPYLYNSGLVDTQHFTYEQWEQAFADCLSEDGKYWVSHRKMLFLGMFRYSRTVGEPFDPLKMRTGKYPIDRLWKVFEKSILPSTSLPKQYIQNTFDNLFRKHKSFTETFKRDAQKAKEKGEEVDLSSVAEPNFHFSLEGGKEFVTLERDHLIHLKALIDTYPSPRRKMELAVVQIRQEKLHQLADMASQSQKSKFEAGQDFRVKTKQDLKDMLVKASEKSHGGRKTMGKPVSIKEMGKPKGPVKF
jgi:hypothetical protein